jgi:putative membrane protein insertion efficiency factor
MAAGAHAGLITLVLLPVRAYQRLISPALPRRCKYEPTCSAYAVQAIRELGVVRGVILAAWRLARCNPWSHGGYDPVEARTLFRSRGEATADPSPPLDRSPEGTVAP